MEPEEQSGGRMRVAVRIAAVFMIVLLVSMELFQVCALE